MAKISVVQRQLKREKTVKRFAQKRDAIKAQAQELFVSGESAWDVLAQFQKLPRNSSNTRLKRRCNLCGRPHGVYRKFGLCRLCLRKYAMQGFVPGIEKSSW